MSAATSPTSAESYGVERVCRIFETPRSTYYARLELVPISRPPPERRGPKPKVSDDELLEYIEADLKSSPFHGEGHRKVWARLRVLRDVRVSASHCLRSPRSRRHPRPRSWTARDMQRRPHLTTAIPIPPVSTAVDPCVPRTAVERLPRLSWGTGCTTRTDLCVPRAPRRPEDGLLVTRCAVGTTSKSP